MGNEVNFSSVDAVAVQPVFAWAPVRSGNYSKDCKAGRAAAAELLALMREDENPVLLRSAIRAAVNQGEWGGFEIGFTTAIAIAAL